MKNWNRKWYLPLMILLTLAGCSLGPSRSHLMKVPLPPQPIMTDSFYLSPLNQDGWIIGRYAKDMLILGANGAVPGETRVIMAVVKPISADMTDNGFTAFAESFKKIEDPKRFEILKRETQKDNSTGKNCVKVRTMLKDLAPRVPTKRTDPMILDSLYWTCKHPEGKKAVIVEYSHRFYPGNKEETFEENAETVFQGLEFVTAAVMLTAEGNRAYLQGKSGEALAKYEAALKAAKDAGDREYEAIAMYGLARANVKLCKPQEAERWFVESIKVRDSLPKNRYAHIIQNLLEYSRLLVATGRTKDAIAPMKRAITQLEAADIIESYDPIEIANAFDEYADALEAVGQDAEAVRLKSQKLRQDNPGRQARFKPDPYPARCKGIP